MSISATEFGRGPTRTARFIRVLAIVFPALSTAVAGAVAFYLPRDRVSRSSAALAGFSELHREIGLSIWQFPCSQAAGAPAITQAKDWAPLDADSPQELKDWVKRYQQIEQAAGASDSETSNGSGENSDDGASAPPP